MVLSTQFAVPGSSSPRDADSRGVTMNRQILCLILAILFVCSSSVVADYENPAIHGMWLEEDSATFVGIKDNFIGNPFYYDFSASNDSYRRVIYNAESDTSESNGWIPIRWSLRDNEGISIRNIWVSLATFSDSYPDIRFSVKNVDDPDSNIDGFESEYTKGDEYGLFMWRCYEAPQTLRYGQPTTYELTMWISSSSAFDIGIDAVYLGDGTYKPSGGSSPFSAGDPFQITDKKLLVFQMPLGTDFDDGLNVSYGDAVDNIHTRTARGVHHNLVIGISGGTDVGDLVLENDFPLKNVSGDKLCDIDINIVSYMKKRFKQNGDVRDKITAPEYLTPSNQFTLRKGTIEFFWLNLDIPDSAKPGIYETRLRINSENVADIMLPLSVEVLPYIVNISNFNDSLSVTKLKTVDATDQIIFHNTPHHLEARACTLTEEEAWRRWAVDLKDIAEHGFNCIVLPQPTLKEPPHFTDEITLGRLCMLARENSFSKLFLDITEVSIRAEDVEGKHYLEEFPAEIVKAVTTVSSMNLEPVLFYDPARMSDNQLDNLTKAINLANTGVSLSTLNNEFTPGLTGIEYPFHPHRENDWIRESIGLSPGNWVYNPVPHWGHHHDMRILSGVYSLCAGSAITVLGVYNESYGNSENDFDIMIGADQYTPGDLMMTYHTEGYQLRPSLRWECFREGLVDRALIELLIERIEEKPSLPSSESAKAFLEYILVYNSHVSARGSLSPDTIELVRERVIDYLLWCDGGDAVALPEINRDVVFTIGSTDFMANGVPMEMTVEPIIIDGSTFIPARYLVEPLGGEALWDGETRSVILIALGHRVQLSIDKTEATSDGEMVNLSKPPTIVNGRTLIPLRAASTLLGAEVSWNGDTKEATCQFNLGVRPLYGE